MSNILVLSFAISPIKGSEYAVGWNFVKHMSKYHKLFVLYGELGEGLQMDDYLNGRKKIENVRFFFCGKKKNLPDKCGVFRDFYESYKETKKLHAKALELAKEIVQKEHIDCIHYLNPIGFKEPSTLWKLDSPYVWGPVQATSTWPWGSLPHLSLKGWREFWLRKIFHNLQFYFNANVQKAFKRADVVVAATPFSKDIIEKTFKRKCLYTPENAIEYVENCDVVRYDGDKLQMFFAGSLIDRKGVILLLKALVKVKKQGLLNKIHLHIFGKGYLQEKMQAFSQKYGIANSITWHGMIQRDELQNCIRGMHLHVLPSLGEATSTILWEATNKRIPTLTLNHCGMNGVLNSQSAFLVDIASGKKMIREIANHIMNILNNPQLIEEKSNALESVINQNLWYSAKGGGKESFWNSVYELAVENYHSNIKL